MKIVINSKFFAHLSVAQLGEKAIELGYDGIDICVRPHMRQGKLIARPRFFSKTVEKGNLFINQLLSCFAISLLLE